MSGPWEQYQSTKALPPEEGPWSQYATGEAIDSAAAEQISRFDYIANEAKKGVVDTPVLAQAILDTFVIDPFKMLYKDMTGQKEGRPSGGIVSRFGKNIERLQKTAQKAVGAEEMKAPDEVTKIAGAGARMVTDPLGLLVGPTKGAKEVVTQAASRVPGLFGLGATTEVGGMAGEQIEKSITGEDTGAGRAIGSIAAGLKGATLIAPIASTAVKAPANVAKQIYDKYKTVKEDPDAASEILASTSAKRLLEVISKGSASGKIDDIVEDYNRISQSINKENLPLMVAMADNPIVRAEVQRLAKTNPAMRERIETELTRLAQNIDNRATTIFGQRYAPVEGVEQVTVKNALKRRETIDNKIDELSTSFIPGVSQENIGAAVKNLVDARVKAATQEMAPVYTSILDDAKKAGAKLPEASVRDVFNFVKMNNIRDIFGKGTAVDKKILDVWGPKEQGFFPAPFTEVESLKREINKLQRGNLTRDEARKLGQLEEVLNNARAQIPGSFNDRLMAADRAYYEKVGVPFGSQGIKDIDSKKYAEQVAPVIIKNSSSLKQFLNASGEEGKTIARNAVLSDAYSKVFKDDIIDPKRLQSYMFKNKEVLDNLPEVQNELKTALLDVGTLRVARANIDKAVLSAEKELADNFIIKATDSKGVSIPDYKALTDSILTNPAMFNKVQKQISTLDPKSAKAVRNAMKAEIVNTAREMPDGGLAFLSNPRNKKTIDSVFGSGYQSAVKDLVKLSDAVKRSDVDRLSSTVAQKDLDSLGQYARSLGVPGLDLPYVTSTIRDRISSIPQKAVRILTRVNTAKMREDTDDAVFDLLFDKNGLQKLQKVSKEFDLNINNPVTFKKITEKISDSIPIYMYGAVKTSVMDEGEIEAPQQFPMGGFNEEQ